MNTNFDLGQLKDLLTEQQVYYDPSFQRRVVWTKQDVNRFFESISKGWANAPITLAEIESCLKHSRKIGDKHSEIYFEKLSGKGYQYVSIDGQNRTKKIVDFLNNEITISGESFFGADGTPIGEVVNKRLNDLKKDPASPLYQLWMNLTHKTVSATIHQNITREQCAEIFRNLNRTKQPNAHNIRQSLSTPVAEFVREVRGNYKNPLKKVLSSANISEMMDDELIAKSLMILTRRYNEDSMNKHWSLNASDIDSWYQAGIGFYNMNDPNCPYDPEELKRSANIIGSSFRCIDKQTMFAGNTKKIPKDQYWCLLLSCSWVFDNNYLINNPALFFKEIRKLHIDLKTKSDKQCAKDKDNAADPNDVKEGDYYHNQVRHPHISDSRIKMKETLYTSLSKQSLKSIRLRAKSAA